MGLVLVDLDGTLLAGATSERRWVAHLLATRRLGPSQALHALSFVLRRWPVYGSRTFKKNKAYLAGLCRYSPAAGSARGASARALRARRSSGPTRMVSMGGTTSSVSMAESARPPTTTEPSPR